MDATVICPGCDARLTLPAVPAGQTVQCPRCQRLFELGRRPAPASPAPPSDAERPSTDDHDVFLPLRRRATLESQAGRWFGYLAIFVIAAHALASLVHAATLLGFDSRDAEALQAIAWLAIPVFAIWLIVVSRNARTLHAEGLGCSSAWVFLFLCVPCVNVIFVYFTLQEIWRASDPRHIETAHTWKNAPAGILIRCWGISLLGAGALSISATPLSVFVRDWQPIARWSFTLANLTMAGADAFLIAIIHAITVRQQQRYIRLYEDPD